MYTNSSGVHKREMRSLERNCLYHSAEIAMTGWEADLCRRIELDTLFLTGKTPPQTLNKPEQSEWMEEQIMKWSEDYQEWTNDEPAED